MAIDRLYLKGAADNAYVAVDTTYGYYLRWRRLSAPSVKVAYDEVPGANSAIDGTEDFGEVFYEDRELELGCVLPSSAWQTPYQNLCSAYHGKQVKISFGNDENYYWTGRLFVAEHDAKEHSLAMTARVYPYKFKKTETTVTFSGYGSGTPAFVQKSVVNGRMRVVPTVTINAEAEIQWSNNSKVLSASSYPQTVRIDGLELGENETLIVKVKSAQDVVIKYREGAL